MCSKNYQTDPNHEPGDAVVLFSGGMDSTTALAIALNENLNKPNDFNKPRTIYTLSIFYGSKHNDREIRAAADICEWYNQNYRGINLHRHMINLAPVFSRAKQVSALMEGSNVNMPHDTYENIVKSTGASDTVVPYRNAVFLSAAVSYANSMDAKHVYAGMHGGDAHNDHYADCRHDFMEAQREAIHIGTYGAISLITPFVTADGSYTKGDVCKTGSSLGAPLHLSYSCYEGREKQCGECPTCLDRLNAFKSVGLVDAAMYE